MAVYAKTGERITDEDGNTVCFVARDITREEPLSVRDFRDWQVPAPSYGEAVTQPGIRWIGNEFRSFIELCIEGEWRPANFRVEAD